MDENKTNEDGNELCWGPIKIISGKHKGRIGYYDDIEYKGNKKFAVVYFDGMLVGEEFHWIRHEHIAPVTTDDLMRRRKEINPRLSAKRSSNKERFELLSEYAYIASVLAERMFNASFTKSEIGKRIFISHSSEDKQFAIWLAVDLANAGHTPWLDEWEIRAGESIPKKIEEGIKNCDFVAVILSEHSVKSNWVEREWQAKYWEEVENGHVKVIPILFNQCQIPTLLKMKKYADFTHSYDYGINDLLAAVNMNGCQYINS